MVHNNTNHNLYALAAIAAVESGIHDRLGQSHLVLRMSTKTAPTALFRCTHIILIDKYSIGGRNKLTLDVFIECKVA